MANFGWGQTAIQFTTMAIAYKNNIRTRALNDAVSMLEDAVITEVNQPDIMLENMQRLSGSSNNEDIKLFAQGYKAGAAVPTAKLDLLIESLKIRNTIKGVDI